MPITPVLRVSALLRSKFSGIVRNASLLCTAAALSLAASAGAQSAVQHVPAPVAVGATVTQPVLVTFRAAGTVALPIRVVTQGQTGLDFQDAGGGSCTNQSYLLSQTCTVNVTVSPTAPGRRSGAVVLLDAANRVLASQGIDVMGTGPLAVIRPGVLQTIAGNNPQWQYSSTDEGKAAATAHIFLPSGVAMDGAGNLYISDSGNNRIRKVTPAPPVPPATKSDILHGTITTFAGGDVNTTLSSPAGLAMDGAGNLYVADSGNDVIRRIDTNGVMTTVAGQVGNESPYAGDGLLATAATLSGPWSVTLDPEGNLYIADTGNDAVRRVDALTGIMTTVASNLNAPRAVAFDPSGVLYIANSADNTVLRVNTNGTTVAYVGIATPNGGSFAGDGGAAVAAHLNGPAALAFDPQGNLYIADSANNRVRRVDAVSRIITTIAGNGGTVMDDNPVNSDIISFSGPYALFLDPAANLFVGDLFHNRVRRVSSNTAILSYPAIRVTKTSAPQKEVIESDGTAAVTPGDLSAGNATVFNQTSLDTATTTCRTGNALQPGSSCNLGVQFAPTTVSAPGSTTPGTFTFKSDATNAPDTVSVSGQVLTVEPTAINLTSSANPAGLATAVIFTAKVAETDGNNGNAIPTGTVTFTYTDGTGAATPLGAPVTLSGGIATVTVSTLTLGQHTIAAAYSGNTTDAASTASLSQSIVQNTNLVLTASPSPSYATQSVTLSAKLASSTGGTPIDGATVTFFNGTTSIGSAATTDANGIATTTVVFPTATLANAPFQLTASFSGDSNNLKSTSNVVSQTVNHTQTTTLLSASPSTSIVGNNVTLTAAVASINGPIPTGTVTFKTGTTTLGTGTLDVNGSASLVTSALSPGQDAVTAIYVGDTANLGSTSAASTVTVNRLPTTTNLASSAPSANAGSTLQLTATVALASGQTAVGTLSGIVTFYDGATIIGSQQVTNGAAVLTTTTLAVGSHALTASYAGNTNYDVSTSTAVAQTVLTSTSTTSLSLGSSTLAGGKSLTMTATVSTAGVKATGNVTFTDGATVLGTAALNSSAVAMLVKTLPVGPHNIVATYNADSNYSVSSSDTATVTVTIGNTVLTLGGTPASATYGASISLNASMTSDGALPSNPSVTLTDNSGALTTLTLNSAGSASFATSTLSVGTHNIVASYAGDANNATAQSQTVTITIVAATTTTTLTSSSPSSHFGDTVTLQAVVASGNANLTGSVTFQEGNTNLGTVIINAAGVATLPISNFSVAQHSIVAIYSGDSTHATSTSTALVQSVVDPTNVSLSSNINPAIGGNAVTFTAQVAGAAANAGVTAAPTGTIVFHEGATILGTVALNGSGAASLTTSSLSVGSHNIVATYSGDIRYAGNDSAVVNQVIRNASSQSTLTTSANPAVYSAPLVLTVRVTGNGGAPTGNVNFLDGTTTIGQAALSPNGTAVFTTSSLAPGIHSLSAIYVGDSNNSTSTAAAVNEQVQQATQISVVSSSNPALTLQQPTLTATVRTVTGALATGDVRFMDGSALLGTAPLSGGVATLVPSAFKAGTHSVTASYAGDTSDLPSVSDPLQLIVNLRATQNTVTATLPTTVSGGVLTLISVLKYDGPVSPTGVTTFSTATGTIGSASVGANGIATLNVQGSAIPGKITATYSGDASYSASTSSPTDITTASATNFTLAVTPATFSVVTKQFSVAQITIHSNDGFADTINLGCGGLPYAATCTFEHDSIKLPANGTVTVKVNIDTGSPLTAGGEASASVQTSHGSSALALLPAGAVLALLAFGRRRRNVPVLMLLLLAACLMPAIGCGTLNQQSTPAGKYPISISAVGQGTGVTLSQGLTMTVTQ